MIGMSFFFILFVSGLQIQQAFAAFETNTTGGRILAVAMALCIEAGAALAAYRLAQLRRREQALPGVLIWALALSVAAPALANLTHILRHTVNNPARPSGLDLFGQILLGVILSLLFPAGLVLAAEVLPEHIRKVEEENATLQRFCNEVQRRLVRVEGEKVAQGQFQEEVRLQLREIEQLARVLTEHVRAVEQRLAEQVGPDEIESPTNSPPPAESTCRWELLWQRAGGEPFGAGLVQEVFERSKTVAYELLKEAIQAGLMEKIHPGVYRFAVSSEEAVRAWVESQESQVN